MGHADMEHLKCPTCQGPMCDGHKYNFSKARYLPCFIPTTAYCENGYYKNRCCYFCGTSIPANRVFQQCEQWRDCEDAKKSLCLMDCCGNASCLEECKTANKGCKFVEREGCHGKLQRRVAVRFGKTPSDTEIIWLWKGEKAPVNVLSYFELRQLATVFSLGKIKGYVREHEFGLQMSLDQCFEGLVVLTPENAPELMTPGTAYAKRRCGILQELELVKTCLCKIDKLCRYVYDNLGSTTEEAPFNELVRDLDADLVCEARGGINFSINLDLGLTSVAAKLEPREEMNSGMRPLFNQLETYHCFNAWMQLPQVDSPIYHQHQTFVNRIAPLLLASCMEQQQCDDKEKQQQQAEQAHKSDAQVENQSPSNDEPSAKRRRSAAGGSDL